MNPTKNRGELICSGRTSSFSSTSGNHRATLVTHLKLSRTGILRYFKVTILSIPSRFRLSLYQITLKLRYFR